MQDKKIERSRILRSYIHNLKPHWKGFSIIVLMQLLVSAIDVYVPIEILRMSRAIEGGVSGFSIETTKDSFIVLILLLGARFILRRVKVFTQDLVLSKMLADLRLIAFSSLIKHSHHFFTNNFAGSLQQKIKRYVDSFQQIYFTLVDKTLLLVTNVFGVIVAIKIIGDSYVTIFVVFALFFALTTSFFVRLKQAYDLKVSTADSKVGGALSDSISNHNSVILFNGADYEVEKFNEVNDEHRKHKFTNWFLWDAINTYQSLIVNIFDIFILWYLLRDWQYNLVTLAGFMLVRSYVGRIVDQLWDVSQITKTFFESFADAQEMVDIMEQPIDVLDPSIPQLFGGTVTNVHFDSISYNYENTLQPVLDQFNLEVLGGERVALIGHSGAGKSTLVKLLFRLYDVSGGVIKINGIDIRQVSQSHLREHIGFVPQDPVLFHRTIADNIRYGKRDATDEEVHDAARKAHADIFIEKLPKGYDTYVGERGVKLSGGERQRIAIARAILKNAPILVLDEATSALDSHSEQLIQDALFTLMEGKTVFVIAHRLSTIKRMDRIVVIEDGKILEDGTHTELLENKGGIYKKLWELQAGGFIVDDVS